jgi:hypothetical protein
MLFGFGKKKDEEKKKPIPVEDRYLGLVQGNLLDNFQNTSYNLKLYMIRAETATGGGWLNGAKAAAPEDTVVIAQTSVTGVQIDNLDLSFVSSATTGNSTCVRAAFTLKQPGAADLLDQIQIAKMHLGHYMYADVPMFLEINFQGYEDDIDDIDAGGKPVTIAGPFIYQLIIAKVSVSIDHHGSDYEFECPIGNSPAFNDFYYKLPKDMNVQGKTIEDMTTALTEGLEKYKQDNLHEEEIHDEIVFDLSQVTSIIKNTSLLQGNNKGNRRNAEQVNRLINAQSMGIKSKKDFEKALEDNPESLDGGITLERGFINNQQINMKEGTNMNQFFTTMFVMCDDFLEGVSRKKLFRDYSIDEDGLDLNQTFVRWYRINADIEYIGFDTKRMKYAKRVTYKPEIYETTGTPVNASEDSTTKEQVTKRVQELKIKKAYHYLYTGLNDQVLNADIQYNAGQVLLGAPGGGKLGDMSTSSNNNSANTDPNQDPSGTADNQDIANAQAPDFKDKLKNDEAFKRKLQSDLRMSDDQFEDFVKDKARVDAAAKAMVFTGYHQNKKPFSPSSYNNIDATSTGSEDGKIDTDYNPDPSGFIYSADLIDESGGSMTAIGESQNYVAQQRKLNSIRNAANGISPEPRTSFVYGPSIVSTSGDTSDGTNAATLFGYMYQNVNNADILISLGLSVRGDPYFLGPPTTRTEALKAVKPRKALEEDKESDKEKEDGIKYVGSDNFFLFTMQTPRVRDPDYNDEDANSGYMSKEQTSYFISGVYRIVSVTCGFSGGQFKVDFDKAPKETSLSLSKFDMTAVAYNAEEERRQELAVTRNRQNAEAEAAALAYIAAQDGGDD